MKLHHGRVEIVLHTCCEGRGDPLLLLHELGGQTRDWSREWVAAWPGPVFGLDLAGHGESGRSMGGYSPEFFLAGADLALERLGDRAAVAGRGLGAYVALLLAGARPDAIRAALLLPGRGLSGGGEAPNVEDRPVADLGAWDARIAESAQHYQEGTDPLVATSEHDLRPSDYVAAYAASARCLVLSSQVGNDLAEPSWWKSLRRSASCQDAPLDPAASVALLHRLAARD